MKIKLKFDWLFFTSPIQLSNHRKARLIPDALNEGGGRVRKRTEIRTREYGSLHGYGDEMYWSGLTACWYILVVVFC